MEETDEVPRKPCGCDQHQVYTERGLAWGRTEESAVVHLINSHGMTACNLDPVKEILLYSRKQPSWLIQGIPWCLTCDQKYWEEALVDLEFDPHCLICNGLGRVNLRRVKGEFEAVPVCARCSENIGPFRDPSDPCNNILTERPPEASSHRMTGDFHSSGGTTLMLGVDHRAARNGR